MRCVFPVVIWSEFCLGQQRDDDHREDAPYFTFILKVSSNFPPSKSLQYSSSSSDRCVYLSISARAISSCDFISCNCLFNLVITLNCLSTVSSKSSAYRNFIKRSFKCNGSQLKNLDISGAIFTLSLSIIILNSQCVVGVIDVRFL